MKFGICVSVAQAHEVVGSGAEFVEEHIQNLFKPLEAETSFAENRERVLKSPLPCPAANCFLPATLPCVGPKVDTEALLRYAEVAFARAKSVGLKIFVFGSAGARKIPEGWSLDAAKDQFSSLLKKLAPIAERNDLTIVVEPLHRKECNFITSLADGAEMVRRADHPNVWLLADLFHMLRDNEPPEEIVKYGPLLRHAHMAEKEKRTAPGVMGDDFRPYFRALKKAGYDRLMALECGWGDRKAEAPKAIEAALKQWKEA